MRLVFCDACATLEEIPDFSGRDDEIDPYVLGVVLKHNEHDPMAHGGVKLRASPMQVYKVDDLEWQMHPEKVIQHVNEMSRRQGMTNWVNESFNTYQEDALRCFKKHGRPQHGCIDYWDDSKRIGRPTKEGKQAVKENYKLGQDDPHLCQWCPVHTYVQMREREG